MAPEPKKEPFVRTHLRLRREQVTWLQDRYPKLGASHVIRVLIDDHMHRVNAAVQQKLSGVDLDLDLEMEEYND